MERIHFKNYKKISLEKLNRHLFVLIVILAAGYFILQIGVTSVVGTKSEEIDQARQEKAQLRLENEILTSKIDRARSIENTQDVAKKLNLEGKTVNFLEEPNLNNVALSNQ